MNLTFVPVLFAGGLLLGMLLLLEMGRRIGVRKFALDPEGVRAGIGAIEGAVFGLIGLLVAFTFSGAASRFERRRDLIVEEANDIGTAYLRLDLLHSDDRAALREKFKKYLDSRLETYRKIPDVEAVRAELARTAKLQNEIWTTAVEACHDTGTSQAAMLLLPAVNQMIDITTTRTVAAQAHAPWIIFAMLGGLALAGALLAGYSMAAGKTRSWLHIVIFAATLAITVDVILDLEHPRLGLIRLDSYDQVLVDLRQSMK